MRTISNPAPLPTRTAAVASKTSAWKTSAALSDELSAAVFACEEYYNQQNQQQHQQHQGDGASSQQAGIVGGDEAMTKPIETWEDFYSWYARLEEAQSREEVYCDERLLAARRQVSKEFFFSFVL